MANTFGTFICACVTVSHMAPDAATTEKVAECEAMGSVDSGDVDQFVIAYPCQDDAWVSVELADATSLDAWC